MARAIVSGRSTRSASRSSKNASTYCARVLADGNPCRAGVADDLVVHVGNVHHVAHGHAAQAQKAPQNVDLQKSAEVADVAVVVDRRPAGVHAQCLAVGGLERIQLSREGVEKAEGHRERNSYMVLLRF